MIGPTSSPDWSQGRVLALLLDQGPVPEGDLYWRSRAASKSWRSTVEWCDRYGWWETHDGLTSITASGEAALARIEELDPGLTAKFRAEFRSPDDPYWTRGRS